MRTIVCVNAKGGCGKSTIAMNLAACLARRDHRVLLIDMDPQAQVTQWLKAGDGIHDTGTITSALAGKESFDNIISQTEIKNLWFVPSSEGLENLSREMTDTEGYYTTFATMLATQSDRFDFAVIDSPNQISPIMESAIWPADLFIVPFESTKAVRSYANFYQLVLKLRPNEQHPILHVLSNLSKQPGLRKRVIQTMLLHEITPAQSEVRTCGWLAQVDEHGGSIFEWRPHSIGAMDIEALTIEVLKSLNEGGEGIAGHIQLEGAMANEIPNERSESTSVIEEVPHLGTFKLHDGELVTDPTPPDSSTKEVINHLTN